MREAVAGISQCEVCWYKNKARVHLGDAGSWKVLQELFRKQHGKCAYTGTILEIGKNASIDHRHPKSLSPHARHDIENLAWVRRDINTAKAQLTSEAFIALCEAVCAHVYGGEGLDD